MTRLAVLCLGLFAATACGVVPPEDTDTDTCIQPDDPGVVDYLDADRCAVALISCDEGEVYFSDACGCGCMLEEATCVDPADPAVTYYLEADLCVVAFFGCDEDETWFGDTCGCGCLAGLGRTRPVTSEGRDSRAQLLHVAGRPDAGLPRSQPSGQDPRGWGPFPEGC